MKEKFNKKSLKYAGLGVLGLAGVFGFVNSGVELGDGNLAQAAEHFVVGAALLATSAFGAKVVARPSEPDDSPRL